MKCINCGQINTQEDKYCTNCGYELIDKISEQKKRAKETINILNKEVDLINAYIGKNVEKIRGCGFSWSTFFIGPLYAFYRKYYSYGLVMIIIPYVIINILSAIRKFTIFFPIIGIIIHWILPLIIKLIPIASLIIFSMKFNERYCSRASKKIDKLQIKYKDLNHEELLKICKIDGGTSIVAPVFLIMFILLLPAIKNKL